MMNLAGLPRLFHKLKVKSNEERLATATDALPVGEEQEEPALASVA